ncbi:hypothetical protein COW80_03730 [Candidatus Beckwithbacteria bacterium CG22_combo_CG10-13_8_21_14_all_01_47_9]|uniref:Uncharacterized protein n=2 Tax=Candidatus Beckwithiibacteriota TaxID=1752726 RepID=A0A2H0E036_9BACT|nr:MAG: hypothetical protein COX09_04715 [Candidatus Beckwithbacteria bacterium CG23_combo_of_CG06-09_8_20_14_all_47_9]PIP87804.1 MAG: hypothetical protein COW80_03730 [Candidatus Beckwithbacteria bacterium CG22_combo_CG10-13_8_21_14_all_01_47_9]
MIYIPIEKTTPFLLTSAEKRQLKIIELDAIRDIRLKRYFAVCEERNTRPDLMGLMLDGYGLGAGDLYSESELDALITADEANKSTDVQKGKI